jgi:glycosyltransferase involved in cell wall biosynthesis
MEPAVRSAVTLCRDAAMSVSVVVPIYNEVENIPLLHRAVTDVMQRLGRPYEMILVNDGSKDGSTAALEELARVDSLVKVIEFRRNYGQTAAMQAGIQAAAHEVTVLLDGDLQNDPTDIPMMLDKIDEGYDLVHGWRKNRQDTFINRKLPSKIANWIISKVTGFPVHDLGCTLKAVRTEIAQELQLYGEMHRFIPILAHWRGARCVEVVTNHHPRRFGQSKYGISRTTRVVLDLMTVKYLIQYVVSPMKLFGMIGLVCGLVASLAGAGTLWMKLASGVDMTGNPLLLLTCLSAMLGVQFFFMGMLGEMCSRIFFEVRGMPNYAIRRTWNVEAPASLPLSAGDRRAA